MCEHGTDPYVIENTRRILRSWYVARAGPGDGRECTYGFLPPYDSLRAFYGEKKMYMHTFQTWAAYEYTEYIILALTVPVNYPGAPCDLGIFYSYLHPILDTTESWTIQQ